MQEEGGGGTQFPVPGAVQDVVPNRSFCFAGICIEGRAAANTPLGVHLSTGSAGRNPQFGYTLHPKLPYTLSAHLVKP